MRTHEGFPVVDVVGEIDDRACPQFDALLMGAARKSANRVILDMHGVTYAGSGALGTLIRVHGTLLAKGGTLAIARCGSRVRRLLETTGVDRTLPVFDDCDGAADYLAGIPETG